MANRVSNRKSAPRVDETGKRYGSLVGISYVGSSKWLWACDCGVKTVALGTNVRKGNTTSCGCVKSARWSRVITKHGLSGTDSIAYRRWLGIRSRVTAKSGAKFRDYASRGVTMCAEWMNNPKAFIEYIGEPLSPDMTVDRIDNTKGYEPGNVRWSDKIQQANNKTNNRIVVYRGIEMTLSQMIRLRAQEDCVPESTMRRRIERGLYRKA